MWIHPQALINFTFGKCMSFLFKTIESLPVPPLEISFEDNPWDNDNAIKKSAGHYSR
jgi:hypothetical protein